MNTNKMSFSDYTKLAEEKNINIIIESLKNGKSPLLQSWSAKQLNTDLAVNPKAQSIYRGVNVLMLDTKSAMNGFKSNSWLTFNQVKEIGGMVKKGSSQVNVFFLQKGKSDAEIKELQDSSNQPMDSKEIEALKQSVFKCYGVFNVDEIDFKDKQVPEYKPEYKPKAFDMDNFQEASQNFRVEGESIHNRVLREQVAKYIIAKDSQTSYEIDDTKKELLAQCPQMLSSDEMLQTLKDASKLSFFALENKQSQKIKASNPYAKIFDDLKQSMRNRGKGYFDKTIWQKAFDLEAEAKKNKLSASELELKLKDFAEELNSYQPKTTSSNKFNNNSKKNNSQKENTLQTTQVGDAKAWVARDNNGFTKIAEYRNLGNIDDLKSVEENNKKEENTPYYRIFAAKVELKHIRRELIASYGNYDEYENSSEGKWCEATYDTLKEMGRLNFEGQLNLDKANSQLEAIYKELSLKAEELEEKGKKVLEEVRKSWEDAGIETKQDGKEALQYFRDNKKEYIPPTNTAMQNEARDNNVRKHRV